MKVEPFANVKDVSKKLGKKLGSGFYGSAFASKTNKNRIIKVFDPYDGGYIDFVKMVLKNPNPSFPKIYDTYKTIVKDRPYNDFVVKFVVEMERLDYRKTERGTAATRKRVAKLFSNVYDAESLRDAICRLKPPKLDPSVKSITAAMKILIRHRMFIFHANDLHCDNFMFRGNTIVITDPVA